MRSGLLALGLVLWAAAAGAQTYNRGTPTAASDVLVVLGDSKTQVSPWANALAARLPATPPQQWIIANGGISGTTVATWTATYLPTLLPSLPLVPNGRVRILMNWGANDAAAMPTQAAWTANYLAIIDAALGRWPTARIYLMRPWRRTFGTECNTLATWIDALVAARPATVSLGPDERVWLQGVDDGASETLDGIHYTALGMTLATAAWRALLP